MRTLVLSGLLVVLAGTGFAADKKISELTSGSPLQAIDMIPIARAGVNFRLAGSDFLPSAGGVLTGPLLFPNGTASVPSGAFTNATGTGFYLAPAGTVLAGDFGTTTGPSFSLAVPFCDFTSAACYGLLLAHSQNVAVTGFAYPSLWGAYINLSTTGMLPSGKTLFLNGQSIVSTHGATMTDGTASAIVSGIQVYVYLEENTNTGLGQAGAFHAVAKTGTTHESVTGIYGTITMEDTTAVTTGAYAAKIEGTPNPTDGTDSSKIFKLHASLYGRSLIDQPRDTDYALELTGGQGLSVSGKTNQLQLSTAAGGAKPACAAGTRGSFWYEAGGVGVADTVEVCRKDSGNAYAWVSVI